MNRIEEGFCLLNLLVLGDFPESRREFQLFVEKAFVQLLSIPFTKKLCKAKLSKCWCPKLSHVFQLFYRGWTTAAPIFSDPSYHRPVRCSQVWFPPLAFCDLAWDLIHQATKIIECLLHCKPVSRLTGASTCQTKQSFKCYGGWSSLLLPPWWVSCSLQQSVEYAASYCIQLCNQKTMNFFPFL